MCLDGLDKVKRFKNIERDGYKSFEPCVGGVRCQLMGNGKCLPVGVWVHEKDFRASFEEKVEHLYALVEDGENVRWELSPYLVGFHILKTKEAAEQWNGVIYKVKFRNVVARGQQFDKVCYVATEMMLVEEA